MLKGLEEPSLTDEGKEEQLLTSKFVLAIGETLLPSEAEVKKPLMEDRLEELEVKGLEVPKNFDASCNLLPGRGHSLLRSR
jgi:hypothetical protein